MTRTMICWVAIIVVVCFVAGYLAGSSVTKCEMMVNADIIVCGEDWYTVGPRR